MHEIRAFDESARGRRPSLWCTVVSSRLCFESAFLFLYFCATCMVLHSIQIHFMHINILFLFLFISINKFNSSARCTINIGTDCPAVRCIGQSERKIATSDHRSSWVAWGREQSGPNHWQKFCVRFFIDHTQRCAGARTKYSIVEQSNCTAFPTK